MFGHSMKDEDFIKLSHFDRVRRGYFDKIPLNFMLIGITLGVNVFCLGNENMSLLMGVAMFLLGFLLKEKFIEKDDTELKKYAKVIEREYQERKNLT